MSEKEKKNSCMGGCLRIVGSGIGLLLLIVALVAGAYILLRAAGAYLIYADELQPADVIVVLSGGTDSRMNEALSLYKEDYAKIIVLTETGEQTEGYEYLNSFDMRIQLINNGIPSGNIMITDLTVNTTVDEAVAIRDLMRNRQFRSAIVVTDPYHTRRSKLVFNQVFDETGIDVIMHPVRSSWYNSRTWFTSVKGWQFTLLEYAKLISMKFGVSE
ncbi:YdcF family protein [Pelolinea submarina]|uniref:DUF218 domain-containing protein n=1 Tax=Pelolinea submarina TaxID=913107 RepID=A0A347ZS92_9CHLR|nr:YdcF family protein [Pelolinea submarina]REG11262.1 DUF218 domain-containing protein [Pelolinea submarina]BBB48173.1 hypothetical protein Pelsub_P1401 [Pelolinea submarina]